MRTRTALLSLTLLFALPAGTAPNACRAAEAVQGDLARLQGCWVTKAGPRGKFRVVLAIEGRKADVRITTPQGLTIRAEGEVRVDDTTAPRKLDWVHFTGLDNQDLPEIAAIYELDGDTLRVCNGGPNNPRPAEFQAGEGVLAEVHVFKRAEPGAGTTAADRGR